MIRKILITAVLVLGALPALAAENRCDPAPIAPMVPDGRTASEALMLSARSAVQSFIKQSDQYQSCLQLDLNQQKAKAARMTKPEPLDPRIIDAYKDKTDTNQREKERVGAEFNAAVHDYKEAHPSPPPAESAPH